MNTFKRSLIGGAIVLALVAGISIQSLQAQDTIDETLRIGFIGSSRGESGDDQTLYRAAVLAAEQINEDDGVIAPDDTRYGFEVVYYEADTQAEVLEVVNEAADENLIALMGVNDTTLAQAIDDDGTPAVPVLLGDPAASEGSYIYTLSAGYETWAEAAADYLTEQRYFEAIGVLTANTDSADAAHDAFTAAVESEAIVTDITFDSDREDFSAEAETIREEDADALFVWATDDQLVALTEALEDVRWDGVIVFGGSDGQALASTTVDTTEMFGLAAWSSAAYDADSQAFVSDYLARWGDAPDADAAAYFDAVYLIAGAVDASGESVSSVASWLSSTGELDGVQGDYSGSQTEAVRLLQFNLPFNSSNTSIDTRSDTGAPVEAALYEAGVCQNCPSYFLEDTTDDEVTSSATLRIGLITAVNGDNQPIGESIEDAVQLAIREINAQGGAIDASDTRYTLSLDVYHAANADEAEAALEEAAADGVQIILGPDTNGQVMPNLSEAESASVLQFVSATNGQISETEAGNYVFQLRATDETMARATADYLTENRDLTRFVTVAATTDYGVDGIDAFADGIAESEDGGIVLELEHDVSETDMSAAADQIVASDGEAVVAWTAQPAAAALLAELTARGWEGLFVYGYLTPDFVAANPVTGIELVGPVNGWTTTDSWAAQDFTTRYTDRYNSDPVPQGAAYYDAVYLIRQAISDNGSDVEDIQSWLLDQDSYMGAQGEYAPESYDSGELTRSVSIISVTDSLVREASRYLGDTCIAYC